MTREEIEIIKAIKQMGVFRTPYEQSKVSAVVLKAISVYEDAMKQSIREWGDKTRDIDSIVSIRNTDDGFISHFDVELDISQPCEDAISRNNAITSICQWGTTLERNGKYMVAVNEVKQTCAEMLCELPYVQPKQKTGHWVGIENDDMNIVGFYCSNCDSPLETDDKTKYCPNCGAKMGVEE